MSGGNFAGVVADKRGMAFATVAGGDSPGGEMATEQARAMRALQTAGSQPIACRKDQPGDTGTDQSEKGEAIEGLQPAGGFTGSLNGGDDGTETGEGRENNERPSDEKEILAALEVSTTRFEFGQRNGPRCSCVPVVHPAAAISTSCMNCQEVCRNRRGNPEIFGT